LRIVVKTKLFLLRSRRVKAPEIKIFILGVIFLNLGEYSTVYQNIRREIKMATKVEVWESSSVKTNCGGDLHISVSKSTSSISGKFVNVEAGKYCNKCPYLIFCSAVKLNEEVKEKMKKVVLYAFTGLKLAELVVDKETKTEIHVTTSTGNKLVFDKVTGLQKNAKNPKFANRIEIA
jgi:hypothetical protein